MNWNLNWINKNAAELQLRKQGKTLKEYPWPDDGGPRSVLEYHHHSDFCNCNPKRRSVAEYVDGQIVIEVK